MAQPPNEIAELVQRFEHNLDAYRSEAYNEARLRQEFLNPFFRSLGWDMDNRQGYAEAYKDVIHEDSIKVGGATKAPDYCFRIGQTRKFFVEAKKPAVNVKHASEPAFQLRRYGWSSKLPLSILTDFEEFAVYDCRVRPNHQDSAAKARVLYLTYSEYLTKWDSIAAIFSRDGVLKGHFDRFLAVEGGKSGTAEVDDAFLSEIESWRGQLANNLAIRNPALGTKEVNFIVQKTIDRVIFLRICEDRGIEGAERLKGIIGTTGVYSALCDLFKQADERYNSGLFHFYSEQDRAEPPDKLSLSVHIDDKLLSDLLGGLYYPDSPYEFSVLPADILGQVYEQFLGKVIRLTPGHRAKVEDKPAVKKAGGVFYTPTYIVDYIVSQTISQVLCDKTPKEAAKIRIIDPACGSGSFLLQAYQHLLDWHRQWYEADGTIKHKKVLYQGPGGGWRLTANERRRILLNNIFGIDIDAQAVEVTKLSLLLKVLEGETEESITAQLRLFHERALPDLGNNIKCGNSLIRPDIERYIDGGLFGDDEVDSVNPFEWKTEFKTIMVSGGFDVVIGNPPWGAEFRPEELSYLRHEHKDIIVRMIDSFMYFVHEGCQKLKKGGWFGMILPDVLLYQGDNQKLREYLLKHFQIRRLLNMGDVFQKVTRPTCICVLQNSPPQANEVGILDATSYTKQQKPAVVSAESGLSLIQQSSFQTIPGFMFATSGMGRYAIWEKVKLADHVRLVDLTDDDGIQRGVSPDLKEAFVVDKETINKWQLEAAKLRPVLTGGKQVRRYCIEESGLFVIYTTHNELFKSLPNIRSYIDQFKSQITCKEVIKHKHSVYALHRPRQEQIFLKPSKIVGVITGDRIIVSIDAGKRFATDGLYVFALKPGVSANYVLGILNSRLFVFLYRLLALEQARVLAQVKPAIIGQLPIRALSDGAAETRQLEKLVGRITSLELKIRCPNTPDAEGRLRRQIASAEATIDSLVYQLYGLSDSDVSAIEQALVPRSDVPVDASGCAQ
jgi:hypothetical protein